MPPILRGQTSSLQLLVLYGLQGLSNLEGSCAHPHKVEDNEWGFARLPSLDEMFAAVQEGKESPFLSRLQSSRIFNSPDCAGSMAEVYRIGRRLEGLKVCGHGGHPCGPQLWTFSVVLLALEAHVYRPKVCAAGELKCV